MNTLGAVYFASSAELVKVGFTAGPPAKRLKGMRSGSASPISFLAALPGCRDLESALHEAMAPWREHGEWFRPNPVLQAALDAAVQIGGHLPVVEEEGFSLSLTDEDLERPLTSLSEVARLADELSLYRRRRPSYARIQL